MTRLKWSMSTITTESGLPVSRARCDRALQVVAEIAPVVEAGQAVGQRQRQAALVVGAQAVLVAAAADLGAHAGDQLVAVDRLDQIVVGADVQALDQALACRTRRRRAGSAPGACRPAERSCEHRRRPSSLPDLAAEDDEVESLWPAEHQRLGAVRATDGACWRCASVSTILLLVAALLSDQRATGPLCRRRSRLRRRRSAARTGRRSPRAGATRPSSSSGGPASGRGRTAPGR